MKNVTVADATIKSTSKNTALQFNGSGTFENCKIEGWNGIHYAIAGGDIVFENCTIKGSVYGINIGEGTGSVTLRNCDITGWNSFGNNGTVTVENCHFHASNYGLLRFYQDATVTNCIFDEGVEGLDVNQDGVTVKINSCTGLSNKLYLNDANKSDAEKYKNVHFIVDGVEATNVGHW